MFIFAIRSTNRPVIVLLWALSLSDRDLIYFLQAILFRTDLVNYI